MKKITTRKFKEGKMKTMKEFTDSYRGYEYKLRIVSYSLSKRKIYKIDNKILKVKLPLSNMLHQCGYIRLKPVDYYLPNQTDWIYDKERMLFLDNYGDIDEITYDRTYCDLGTGRWIGIDFAHYQHFINPASYINVVKALRKIIDTIIIVREANKKEKVV